MSEPSAELCLKPGKCLNQQGRQITLCPKGKEGERYVETTPLLPAESLCLGGLRSYVESRSPSPIVDDWSSICFDLDRAIALPKGHAEVRGFQNDLLSQINIMLLRNSDNQNWLNPKHPIVSLQLKRLGIFMPAFRDRVMGRTSDQHLTRQIHQNLTGYIDTLSTYSHSFSSNLPLKKQIAAHQAECEVMALFTRVGELPFPALSREEASHARRQHNHDFYTMSGNRKRPYQVKTSAQGSGYSGVAVIRHYEILRGFHKDTTSQKVEWRPSVGHQDYEWPNPYHYTEELLGQKLSPLADLLMEEKTLGSRLSVDKRNALNLASSYVRSIKIN